MIKIAYNKHVDKILVHDVERHFQMVGLEIESKEQIDGVTNAFWWALPPLIAFWIGKSYLDGLLKELGKDSAGPFKIFFQKLYSELQHAKVRSYNRQDLEKIKTGAEPASVGQALPTFCISIQISETAGRKWGIRCIFPSGLSENDAQKAILEMQNILPSLIEIEHQRLSQLKENQMLLGSQSYIYDVQQGWVSSEILINQIATKKT